MAVDWGYYDKFDELSDKYLPVRGEGETMATQIVTAVSKLVYKWYNDGDTFDNTHYMAGWVNDLSSYANWLYHYTAAGTILDKIATCYTDDDYEELLKELADMLINASFLAKMDKMEKVGTIYSCDGKFRFVENDESDEDDDYMED